MNEPPRALRCAIYTRKSTEEGLEQEFNSLQAQRESAEAFVASQREAGWNVHPERYDDGGYGGATLERPALTRLLAALERGEMDCVVVYKVDRLSRSLLDFARLMGLFERLGVSFVSVTQQFATTTSLGRLTLNILLSFAQFERELIGERTRDKMSAARRKGKWMGGIPVLGYDVDARGGRLVVNAEEAERVRRIFGLCAEAGTLSACVAAVNAQGLGTKEWTSRNGRRHESRRFGEAALARLLGNVLYKGLVSHKRTPYAGEQEAIVETELWDRVNRQLQDCRTPQAGARPRRREAPLRGLLRCACGAPMVATHTRKAGLRHEYYVCSAARKHACGRPPVAARDLEPSLQEALRSRLGEKPEGIALRQTVERLSYDGASRETTVVLRDGSELRFAVAIGNRRGARSRSPVKESGGRVPRVSRLMALAFKLEDLVQQGQSPDYAALARAGHVSRARLSQIVNLTQLAPSIQETLLFLPGTVRGPDRVSEKAVRDIARHVDWDRQKKLFEDLLNRGAAESVRVYRIDPGSRGDSGEPLSAADPGTEATA